jgi:hypothetical protein
MWDNEKSTTSLMPPSNGLSCTQFSKLNSAGINGPTGPEQYNITEVKNWATFLQLPHSTWHLLL